MIKSQPHLQDYFQVLMRRRWVIFTFFFIIVVSVLIGSLKQTPIYETSTTLLIERRSPQILSVQEVAPMGLSDYYAYKEYYETQYKLIKGRILLKSVADSLGMKHNPRRGKDPVERLLKAIKVIPVKKSQLVSIYVEDPDPVMAAMIANTVATEYIKYTLKKGTSASNNAAEWLSEKIEEQRKKLINAEQALANYRGQYNINILPKSGEESAIEDVKAEYSRLQALLANYSQRYTSAHPKVIELTAQIGSLRNKIDGLDGIDRGNKTMQYRVLEREVQTNKSMYETLLARLKEIDLSSTMNVSNISVVDSAIVPDKPVRPNFPLNIALSVMAGIVLGVGFGFFIDYLDTTIKSPQDIRDLLDAYCIGSIPEIVGKEGIKKDKIVHLQPSSPISEAYRSIRTEALGLIPKKNNTTLLVTSAEPKAGKTMTCVNFAISLAQQGNSVLVIDSDLRKPQFHHIFGVDRRQGLSEYLLKNASFESIIKDSNIENMKIITSGKVPRNPAEALSSARMAVFIREATQNFDYTIFDSPPAASVTDSVIVADMVDATIQVVRSGKAPIPVVLRVKEKLENTRSKFLGMILNDTKTYHGDYYSYKYYRYYGEDVGKRRALQKTAK